jgi:hypothetical protein
MQSLPFGFDPASLAVPRGSTHDPLAHSERDWIQSAGGHVVKREHGSGGLSSWAAKRPGPIAFA